MGDEDEEDEDGELVNRFVSSSISLFAFEPEDDDGVGDCIVSFITRDACWLLSGYGEIEVVRGGAIVVTGERLLSMFDDFSNFGCSLSMGCC